MIWASGPAYPLASSLDTPHLAPHSDWHTHLELQFLKRAALSLSCSGPSHVLFPLTGALLASPPTTPSLYFSPQNNLVVFVTFILIVLQTLPTNNTKLASLPSSPFS